MNVLIEEFYFLKIYIEMLCKMVYSKKIIEGKICSKVFVVV